MSNWLEGRYVGMKGWFNILKSTHATYHINKGQQNPTHAHLNRCRKASDKHPTPVMIKIHNKLAIEENFLNPIKGICETHN